MRIDGIQPALGQALIAALTDRREGFSPTADGAAVQTPPPVPMPAVAPQAVTSVQMLVALASLEPVVERRRRLAVEADRGLSLLEQLHRDLAAGITTPERLQALAAWAADFSPPDDPVLAAVARDIETRVRVELARHERIV